MAHVSSGIVSFDLLARRSVALKLLYGLNLFDDSADVVSVCMVQVPGDVLPWYRVWSSTGDFGAWLHPSFWNVHQSIADPHMVLAGGLRVDLIHDDCGMTGTIVALVGQPSVPITLMYDGDRPIVDSVLEAMAWKPGCGWLEQLSEAAERSEAWLTQRVRIDDVTRYGQVVSDVMVWTDDSDGVARFLDKLDLSRVTES